MSSEGVSPQEQHYMERDRVLRVSDLKSFVDLFRFVKPLLHLYLGALLLLGTGSVTMMYSARVLGHLVQSVLVEGREDRVWLIVTMIIAFEVVAILCAWGGRRLMAIAGSSSILDIRRAIFAHIHKLPISYYDRQPDGRTITRMTHDVEGIEQFFVASMGRIIGASMTFISALVAMLLTDWRIAIWLIISIIPAVWMNVATKGRIRVINRDMSRYNSVCNSKLSEYLGGLPLIRSFGLEGWTSAKYQGNLDDHLNSVLRANRFYSWSRPLNNFLTYLPLLFLFYLGGQGVLAGSLTMGVFVTFLRYCERFAQPIGLLTREIHVIQQAFTSAERVTTFLAERQEDDLLGVNGSIAQKLKGEISFHNLTMGYNDRTVVLKGVTFNIQTGRKVGLVGRTGSGKTTTVALLSRLYPFQQGEITLDGIPIAEFKRESIRAQIGMVSQDVVIFHGSLMENLLCGLEIEQDELVEACSKSGLARVMREKDLTFESEILEGGANLSVGQKQLIALTRVLIRQPAILILDEATANIDPYYESIIQEAVESVMEGRTCLIIAHRLNTLNICDEIMVFADGKLVESGSAEQLLSKLNHDTMESYRLK
jgi:ATP-binding cassette, subfamily B, multidrug efflux pump